MVSLKIELRNLIGLTDFVDDCCIGGSKKGMFVKCRRFSLLLTQGDMKPVHKREGGVGRTGKNGGEGRTQSHEAHNYISTLTKYLEIIC